MDTVTSVPRFPDAPFAVKRSEVWRKLRLGLKPLLCVVDLHAGAAALVAPVDMLLPRPHCSDGGVVCSQRTGVQSYGQLGVRDDLDGEQDYGDEWGLRYIAIFYTEADCGSLIGWLESAGHSDLALGVDRSIQKLPIQPAK